MILGQPVAGIVAALAEILAVLSGDGSPAAVRKEAAGYFGSAILATVLCIAGFTYFQRLPVAKYYLSTKKKDTGHVENLDRVKSFLPYAPLIVSFSHSPNFQQMFFTV